MTYRTILASIVYLSVSVQIRKRKMPPYVTQVMSPIIVIGNIYLPFSIGSFLSPTVTFEVLQILRKREQRRKDKEEIHLK